MTDGGGPTVGSATHGQVVLACVRKQSEQGRRSEPVSSIFPGPCFGSCLGSPPWSAINWGLSTNPSLPPSPQVAAVGMFCLSDRASYLTVLLGKCKSDGDFKTFCNQDRVMNLSCSPNVWSWVRYMAPSRCQPAETVPPLWFVVKF